MHLRPSSFPIVGECSFTEGQSCTKINLWNVIIYSGFSFSLCSTRKYTFLQAGCLYFPITSNAIWRVHEESAWHRGCKQTLLNLIIAAVFSQYFAGLIQQAMPYQNLFQGHCEYESGIKLFSSTNLLEIRESTFLLLRTRIHFKCPVSYSELSLEFSKQPSDTAGFL